ncbi:MAG: aconitase family protein [Hyphomicrobiales bacterium]|nr:aconitase family protein [Hyphomicrobiales bacterium]
MRRWRKRSWRGPTLAVNILAGRASGRVLASNDGLSFWGGVDPATGYVIDSHHPLCGQSLAGAVVAMPTSRGSCTGSGVLLELIENGLSPAALVFREAEDVLTLGALVGRDVFGQKLPIVRLEPAEFSALAVADHVAISVDRIEAPGLSVGLADLPNSALELTTADRHMLEGGDGKAVQTAMQIVCSVAAIHGASQLIDVSQVHIDGCLYAGPVFLRFAEFFADQGARVRVPTTLNAISVDHANWRDQGVPSEFGLPASRLADAYLRMGARASFTCAPYLLDTAPKAGDAVAWAESNAVVYANSVLAARTNKHPDFLDLCIALTGRAPLSGVYLDANRRARRIISVEAPAVHDDSLWPLLGYLAGLRAPDCIPILTGLQDLSPSPDDLKALCAAFGTTSSAPMLHLAGISPEAGAVDPDADTAEITRPDLVRTWQQFNSGPADIDLVAFGSPHFSIDECRALAQLMDGNQCADRVTGIVTLGRDAIAAARAEGLIGRLENAGFRVLPDLCWCSITEPVFPPHARTLMTNSGKYAHYAPGLSGRRVRFGSLADCVQAVRTGRASDSIPAWLQTENFG